MCQFSWLSISLYRYQNQFLLHSPKFVLAHKTFFFGCPKKGNFFFFSSSKEKRKKPSSSQTCLLIVSTTQTKEERRKTSRHFFFFSLKFEKFDVVSFSSPKKLLHKIRSFSLSRTRDRSRNEFKDNRWLADSTYTTALKEKGLEKKAYFRVASIEHKMQVGSHRT